MTMIETVGERKTANITVRLADGEKKIFLNGVDVSNIVSRLEIVAPAGEIPIVALYIPSESVDIECDQAITESTLCPPPQTELIAGRLRKPHALIAERIEAKEVFRYLNK